MRRFCCVFCLDITFLPPGCKTLLSSLFFLFFCFQSFAFQPPLTCAVANSSHYDLIYHGISIKVIPAASTAISAGIVTAYLITAVGNMHADGSCMFYTYQKNVNTHLSKIQYPNENYFQTP